MSQFSTIPFLGRPTYRNPSIVNDSVPRRITNAIAGDVVNTEAGEIFTYFESRYGEKTLESLSSEIQGIYYWSTQRSHIVIYESNVYEMDLEPYSFTKLSDTFIGTRNVIDFAEINDNIYISAGGLIYELTSERELAVINENLAPNDPTTIVSINGSLVTSTRGSDLITFSDAFQPRQWGTYSYVSAEKEGMQLLLWSD